MLENLLSRNEGKTLEFKESTQNLRGIIKTVVSFANTAGGAIVIGIKDKTKEIIGLKDVLFEEEKIANAIAESITPLIRPDIDIQTYRKKEIIIIHVSHGVGPYYIKADGPEKGVYVRFGSTNRVADSETINSLRLLVKNITFDELPLMSETKNSLDWLIIKNAFKDVGKIINEKKCQAMGVLTENSGKLFPTAGGVILFGIKRKELFPDAIIRCARFQGTQKVNFLDQKIINTYLNLALDEIISFIDKHISVRSIIGKTKRTDIPQYPEVAIRESIINALVHTDYAMRGTTITIAIFDDRIEITNPGGLPFGMTIDHALTGSSRIRNHVIARVFNELKLIEQWGTGIKRIIDACNEQDLKTPLFEEINNQFKVTIYSDKVKKIITPEWQRSFMEHLQVIGELGTNESAKFWNVDVRTARRRLKQLLVLGIIVKIKISKTDPYGRYIPFDKIKYQD